MANLRLLSENFFNVGQFSSHTITASTYQSGNEPWRVGTSRRAPRNAWISPTTGEQYIQVTCDQVRSADMVCLDRGYNATSVKIQYTSSTAAGWTTHEDVTLPTVTQPNWRVSDSPGVYTSEGAWVYRFAKSTAMPTAKNWRLAISLTTGSGHKVVGAYLGKSFSPGSGLRPWDDEASELVRSEVVSPELWTAGARVATRRVGSITALLSDVEGDQATYHVRNLFDKGEVAWVLPNEDQAETAQLAISPSGGKSLPYTNDWPTRTLSLEWTEHQPKPR